MLRCAFGHSKQEKCLTLAGFLCSVPCRYLAFRYFDLKVHGQIPKQALGVTCIRGGFCAWPNVCELTCLSCRDVVSRVLTIAKSLGKNRLFSASPTVFQHVGLHTRRKLCEQLLSLHPIESLSGMSPDIGLCDTNHLAKRELTTRRGLQSWLVPSKPSWPSQVLFEEVFKMLPHAWPPEEMLGRIARGSDTRWAQ